MTEYSTNLTVYLIVSIVYVTTYAIAALHRASTRPRDAVVSHRHLAQCHVLRRPNL